MKIVKHNKIKIEKGAYVTVCVKTPSAVVEEQVKIDRIIGNKIYLENLDIPFYRGSGMKTECISGSKVYIKEIYEAP